jgi:hypothetical protein
MCFGLNSENNMVEASKMATKNNPGEYDCYGKAQPDEPMFILLARDIDAPEVVRFWIQLKNRRGGNNIKKLIEAGAVAAAMSRWGQGLDRAPGFYADRVTLGEILQAEMNRIRRMLEKYLEEGFGARTLRTELEVASNALVDGSVDDIIAAYQRLRLYQ